MTRALRFGLLGLLSLVLALALLTAWAMTTQAGTRALLTQIVLPLAGVDVSGEDIHGRLIGPLTLHDMEMDLAGGRMDLARVRLLWRPAHLLRGVVHVDRLQIEGARLELPDDSAASDEEPFELDLPVEVRVLRLEIIDSSVLRDAEPLVSDLSAALSLEARGQAMRMTGLEAQADRGGVEGRASVSTAADGVWDVDLRWRWNFDALENEKVGGHLRARGIFTALVLDLAVNGLVTGALSARVRGLPDQASWDAEVELEPLPRRAELWPETLAGASGRLASRGNLDGLSLQGALSVPELIAGDIGVEAHLGWAGDALELDGVLIPRASDLPDAELALRGHWRDSVLTLEQVRFASDEAGVLAVGHVAAHITEEDIEYEFALEGSFQQAQWPELRFHAAGRGDPAAVRLERLRAEALGGELVGGGTLAWANGVHVDLTWMAHDIDPGVYWSRWPGQLGGEIRVQGELLPERDLTVTAPLEGRLRDRVLRADLEAQLQGEVLAVSRSELRLGETLVTVDGRLAAERTDLKLMLDSRDLQDLHPDARGALAASAALRRSVEAPVVSLQLEGSEMGWLGHALEKIAADVQLDLSDPQGDSRLALELSGLSAEEPLLDSLTLTAAGTRDQHHAQLAGRRAAAQWSLILQGGLDDGLQWNGRLDDLLLAMDREPLWRLREPASLSAGTEHARLARTCLEGGALGETCVAAQWHVEDGWQARLSLADLDLRSFGEWVGADFVAQGRVVGRVDVRSDAEGFEHLAGGVELSAGSLAPRGFPDEPLLVWNRSTIRLSGDASRATAEARVDLAERRGGIEGRLQIGWNDEDPPLDGRLAAELTQAELVTVFVPELARLEGRVGGAVDLAGTLSQPDLRGELFWENGAASMPMFGARAHDIELRGTVSDERGLQFTATARAGDGEVRSEGRFTLPPEPLAGEVHLSGTNALVVNLPGTQVLASPKLTLSYREDRITLTGDVRIPYGRITALPQSHVPEQVAEVSADEFIVGAEAGEIEQAELPEVLADIRMLIGPDFRVDAEGLAGEIEGDVQLVQLPHAEPVARGQVNILEGSFTLFEQPLIIGEGRLLYSDTPLENPALDIRAELTTEDVLVGAIIRGSLLEPEVTIFSEPPMPEAEVLSYMITGRGLHDLRTDEAEIVHSAANSVMMAGSDLLARQVGTRLGFDATGATGGAEPGSADLVIGLHLGSRLFVSYGVGLYEAISAMRLRYRLTRRWALEVISGDVSSADVMGTVER